MNDATAGPLAVILAAGLGTRMRSRRPKVLHPVCGRPMLAHVLDVARTLRGPDPLVVVSPATERVRQEIGADGVAYALQAEPLGTADALRSAMDAVPPGVDEIIVLSGDVPLLRPATVRELVLLRRSEDATIALAVTHPADPRGYGRVVRDLDGRVARIIEEKDADEATRRIGEANAGLYAFNAAWVRSRIADVAPSPTTGEYYLPELVAMAHAEGGTVVTLDVADERELAGINDLVQLAEAEGELRRRIVEEHMRAGVTMLDPRSVTVESGVEIAPDVVLEAGVILQGRTRIGADSVIGAGSRVVDSVVGERCRVWSSVIESSEIGDDVRIGPWAHLRPGTRVGDGAEVGNFAEIKASTLGPGSKQHHFSYLGDATIGTHVNIGAGTVTCNYDGRRKHPTRIGDGAFIGSDTMLVAPVDVGAGARTGAGSVVTRDVPDGMLAVGVPARLRRPRDASEREIEPGTIAAEAGEASAVMAGAADDPAAQRPVPAAEDAAPRA
ncbi:MAG: bifunctional UDP-N-acetylglucosamine diphosphorylase/glucosamine-1-phosphate N-acetyltransferase GlmU [Chloroflexi bacterium]|nr:bifunctional UDP-N-acetylglucosamine diphosphorylase/glucosamine-1-phosphate N-acetyltransferase GlmU [Chloroflexota bacterium]